MHDSNTNDANSVIRYAGFAKRLLGIFIDILFRFLFFTITMYLANGILNNSPAWSAIAMSTMVLCYWIILWHMLVKYGATPGKLAVGIKVTRLDFTNIGFKEAFLRHVIDFIYIIAYWFLAIWGLFSLPFSEYQSLLFWKKFALMKAHAPQYFNIIIWAGNIWVYSELLVLLLNKKKRALHDFIAGTVVIIRKKTV
jgi:uncharacterized RDD family membrane protein YckC